MCIEHLSCQWSRVTAPWHAYDCYSELANAAHIVAQWIWTKNASQLLQPVLDIRMRASSLSLKFALAAALTLIPFLVFPLEVARMFVMLQLMTTARLSKSAHAHNDTGRTPETVHQQRPLGVHVQLDSMSKWQLQCAAKVELAFS